MKNVQDHIRDAMRAKSPILAKKAERGHRAACVWLFCVECMGGMRKEAANCPQRDCFLWPARPRKILDAYRTRAKPPLQRTRQLVESTKINERPEPLESTSRPNGEKMENP